jgi:hypothetical protein
VGIDPDIVITQQEELYRQLETFGWRKVEDEEFADQSLDWWVHEVWVLESIWQPQECRVFLTFVKNPHEPSDRAWAGIAALEGPIQSSEVELLLERPGRRKEGLAEFFAGLAGLRAAWQRAHDPV